MTVFFKGPYFLSTDTEVDPDLRYNLRASVARLFNIDDSVTVSNSDVAITKVEYGTTWSLCFQTTSAANPTAATFVDGVKALNATFATSCSAAEASAYAPLAQTITAVRAPRARSLPLSLCLLSVFSCPIDCGLVGPSCFPLAAPPLTLPCPSLLAPLPAVQSGPGSAVQLDFFSAAISPFSEAQYLGTCLVGPAAISWAMVDYEQVRAPPRSGHLGGCLPPGLSVESKRREESLWPTAA